MTSKGIRDVSGVSTKIRYYRIIYLLFAQIEDTNCAIFKGQKNTIIIIY
jgi:hypothetical protein